MLLKMYKILINIFDKMSKLLKNKSIDIMVFTQNVLMTN